MAEASKQYWIIATAENEGLHPELESRREELAAAHQTFIRSLDERGILLAHGAARDELGKREGTGFIVFEAVTRRDAATIAMQEPYIANGFRTLRLIPWQAKLGRVISGLGDL